MKKITQIFAIALVAISVGMSLPAHTFAADSCDASSIVSDSNTLTASGQNAVAANTSSYWTAQIPGATWIWSTATPTNPQQNQSVTFHRDFTVGAVPSSATLSIAADDLYNVQVNGVQIGSIAKNDPFMKVGTFNIASALKSGNNTITITGTNLTYGGSYTAAQNPAGILYRIDFASTCGSSTGSGGSGGSSGTSGQYYFGGSQTTSTGGSTGGSTTTSTSITGSVGSAVGGLLHGFEQALAGSESTSTATDTVGVASTSSSTPAVASNSLLASVGAAIGAMPYYGWIALLLLLIAIGVLIAGTRKRSRS